MIFLIKKASFLIILNLSSIIVRVALDTCQNRSGNLCSGGFWVISCHIFKAFVIRFCKASLTTSCHNLWIWTVRGIDWCHTVSISLLHRENSFFTSIRHGKLIVNTLSTEQYELEPLRSFFQHWVSRFYRTWCLALKLWNLVFFSIFVIWVKWGQGVLVICFDIICVEAGCFCDSLELLLWLPQWHSFCL